MTPIERLDVARAAAMQGRHADALRGFIWFHHNALAEDPALRGVRLSFALADWTELGKVYPEALLALEEIRDEKAAALLRGEASLAEFRDVAAINERLESTSSTYQLYIALAKSMPDLAKSCVSNALPAIVEAKDYRLARELYPEPETLIRSEAAWLNADVRKIKGAPYSAAPRRWAHIRNFVDAVRRQLTVLIGNGENAEALRLKALALQLIQSPSLRRAVQAEFIKPSKAPIPRRRRHG
jgi:hypothetical protein